MKKFCGFVAFILVFAITLSSVQLFAIKGFAVESANDVSATVVDSGTFSGNLTWQYFSDDSLIISGSGSMSDYGSSSGLPWYSYMRQIKKVVVNEGVTGIGQYAFRNAENLQEVVLPNSLTRIGPYAFYACTSLVDITLPTKLNSLGIWAFAYCEAIEKVHIPDMITQTEAYIFIGCTNLKELIIHGGFHNFGKMAFSNCNNLKDIYYYGDADQWDDVTGLSGNESIQNATIHTNYVGENVTWSLDSEGVLHLIGFGNMVDFVPPVSYVTPYAMPWYKNRTKIKSVIISEGITNIGALSFVDCTKLVDVTIPNSVTEIGENAFTGSNNVEIFGKRNSYAHTYAVANSIPFHAVAINGEIDGGLRWNLDGDGNLFLSGDGDIPSYIDAGEAPWCEYENDIRTITIQSGIASIGDFAFAGLRNVETVVLPEGISDIGANAFGNCSALKNIILPETLTTIGDQAFLLCESLEEIVISKAVTSIGSAAFAGCSNLSIYGFPESAAELFAGSNGIPFKPAIIASGTCGGKLTWSVDSFGLLRIAGTGHMNSYSYGAALPSYFMSPWYDYRDKISSILVEEGVSSVGTYAFAGCSPLKAVTVPVTTDLNSTAFEYCKIDEVIYTGEGAIKDYPLNQGAMYVNTSPWYRCSYVTKVVFPEGITHIGDYLFFNCKTLKEAVVPKSVTSIGAYAFSSNEDLVIYGYYDTEAENDANEHAIPFSLVSELSCITVTPPAKTSYYPGESLDISGITVIAHYQDGTQVEVSTYNVASLPSNVGSYSLLVSYRDCSAQIAVEVIPRPYIVGDVNADGSVDTLDRLTLSRYLANWEGYTIDTINVAGADLNCDGSIDTLDRLILSRHLANWSGYEDLPYVS